MVWLRAQGDIATLDNVLPKLLAAYRRAGGDPPLVDTGGVHGSPMEGYFWRIANERDNRCVVAMIGFARSQGIDDWGIIGMGASPASTLLHEITAAPTAASHRLEVALGDRFRGTSDELHVELGDARISARFANHVLLPGVLGGLGLGHLVPGLPTYWTPSVISADVEGEATYAGETFSLDGSKVYVEKNWGSVYPSDWWWGQSFFEDGAASVVFAGGRVPIAGRSIAPTALVFQHGTRVARLGPPFSLVRSSSTGREWHVRGIGQGLTIDLEGHASELPPIALPVPVPPERRTEPRALEYLAGGLTITVRRGLRVILRSESTLAGLEIGLDRPAETTLDDWGATALATSA